MGGLSERVSGGGGAAAAVRKRWIGLRTVRHSARGPTSTMLTFDPVLLHLGHGHLGLQYS
jgi:hypothetical protein